MFFQLYTPYFKNKLNPAVVFLSTKYFKRILKKYRINDQLLNKNIYVLKIQSN